MNELIFIRTSIDEFTEKLIGLCKPLMTNPDLKKEAASLLNSESNLRMVIEFACEATSQDELLKKLMLSVEELSTMQNILEKSTFTESVEKTWLLEKAVEINSMLENLIQNIK